MRRITIEQTVKMAPIVEEVTRDVLERNNFGSVPDNQKTLLMSYTAHILLSLDEFTFKGVKCRL